MKRTIAVTAIIIFAGLLLHGCITAEGLYITKDGTYYRTENGQDHTGFLETDDGTLYFDETGKKVEEGIVTVGGSRYFIQNGKLVTDWQDPDLPSEEAPSEPPQSAASPEPDLIPETPEPSEEPDPTPSATPTPTQSTSQPKPAPLVIEGPTGNEKLDKAVVDLVGQVCSTEYSDEKNLGILFDWMVTELKYKYVTVDLSNGYTEDLINELAESVILTRRGACEHQAALMAVFIRALGFESMVVEGDFLSDDRTEWVEHGWALGKIGDTYYHFDPLFGRNHTNNPRSFFMKKDAEIEHLHRWDRDAYPVSE